MAGHPTIGSTFALAAEGRIQRGRDKFVFELGVGPIEVSLEWSARRPGVRLDDAAPAEVRPARDQSSSRSRRRSAWIPPISTAIGPFNRYPAECPSSSCRCARAVRSMRSRSIGGRSHETLTAAGIEPLPVFVFTNEKGGGDETVYSRMLAPGFGISEDPATGGGQRSARMLSAPPRHGDGGGGATDGQPSGCCDEAPEPHAHLDRQ